MNPRLLISPCGCTSLIDLDARGLQIIDGNNLPSSEIMIISLSLNSVQFEISETFESLADFQAYLNTTFVITYDLLGYFTFEDDNLYYSNPENFTTGEVMAILRRQKLVLRVGTAPGTQGIPVSNAMEYQRPELVGATSLNVTFANIPLNEGDGYVYNATDGRIIAAGDYADSGFMDGLMQITFNQPQI